MTDIFTLLGKIVVLVFVAWIAWMVITHPHLRSNVRYGADTLIGAFPRIGETSDETVGEDPPTQKVIEQPIEVPDD